MNLETDNRIKPTTQIIGAKANILLHQLALENGIATKFFLTTLLIREARAQAVALDSEKLKERLALIDEVQNEQRDLISNPPREVAIDWDYSTNPRAIYMKIWQAHKRLTAKGYTDEQIHDYCILRYGIDFPVKDSPQKTPKKNPDWVGGRKKKQ